LNDGQNIYQDITNAYTHHTQGESINSMLYAASGSDFGKALVKVYSGKSEPFDGNQTLQITMDNVEYIVKGILMGAIKTEFDDFDYLQLCIQDAEKIYDDIKDAITEFKKHSESGTKQGLKDIGDIVMRVKKELS